MNMSKRRNEILTGWMPFLTPNQSTGQFRSTLQNTQIQFQLWADEELS